MWLPRAYNSARPGTLRVFYVECTTSAEHAKTLVGELQGTLNIGPHDSFDLNLLFSTSLGSVSSEMSSKYVWRRAVPWPPSTVAQSL